MQCIRQICFPVPLCFLEFWFLATVLQAIQQYNVQSKRTAGEAKESEKHGERRGGEQNTKAAGAVLREMLEMTSTVVNMVKK